MCVGGGGGTIIEGGTNSNREKFTGIKQLDFQLSFVVPGETAFPGGRFFCARPLREKVAAHQSPVAHPGGKKRKISWKSARPMFRPKSRLCVEGTKKHRKTQSWARWEGSRHFPVFFISREILQPESQCEFCWVQATLLVELFSVVNQFHVKLKCGKTSRVLHKMCVCVCVWFVLRGVENEYFQRSGGRLPESAPKSLPGV